MLFKCIRSGRTMEVTDPEDIVQMKSNESYIEVSAHSHGEQHGLQETAQREVEAPRQDAVPVKRRGRPARVAMAEQEGVI